jgi:hypothetical protein
MWSEAMFEVGKHIDDQNTGARLVIEAVEKDHVLCRIERQRRTGKKQRRSRQNSRRAVGSDKA